MADDREIWARICEGNARAFDAFYRDAFPRLRGFLRRLLGDDSATEDVAQEAFIQLWRRPNGFDPERGSLRAYLFGIGRKRAADWWRKRRPEDGSPLPETPQGGLAMDASSAIGDAFARLAADQRSLLWLREVEGQSYDELAEILEIPVGTVRSRLFAAREELRRIWRSERTQNEVDA